MEYLEASNPEWSSMWEALGNEKLNGGDPICLHDGHCWEYLGSTDDHHHFRHATHPRTHHAEFAYIERVRMVSGWH